MPLNFLQYFHESVLLLAARHSLTRVKAVRELRGLELLAAAPRTVVAPALWIARLAPLSLVLLTLFPLFFVLFPNFVKEVAASQVKCTPFLPRRMPWLSRGIPSLGCQVISVLIDSLL